jgi:hypothetical protein
VSMEARRDRLVVTDNRPCKDCRWWLEGTVDDRGECHRHPKVATSGESAFVRAELGSTDEVRWSWPVTASAEWCGDFEPNEAMQQSEHDKRARQVGAPYVRPVPRKQ